MKIEVDELPPVSQKFYDKLIIAFPPIDALDIKKDTNMIDVHRNAAQQEVIQYVSKVVRGEPSTIHELNIWGRLKYVLNIK